jgi:ribosome-associated protein
VTGALRAGRLLIPEAELEYRFSTSGGPGGQHANRSSTRVELIWNIERSGVLGSRQRDQIRAKLRHRIDGAGNLRVVSDSSRSQLRNREAAAARLAALVSEALRPQRKRTATSPTRAAKLRRLDSKKRRATTKRLRRPPTPDA